MTSTSTAEQCRLRDKKNKDTSASTAQPAFWVAVYPEVGLSFQRILSTAGIAAVTKVSEMPLHYFPFDKDVLCMHRPEAVKELLTDSNPAILSETARVRSVAAPPNSPVRMHAHPSLYSVPLPQTLGSYMRCCTAPVPTTPRVTIQQPVSRYLASQAQHTYSGSIVFATCNAALFTNCTITQPVYQQQH